MSFWDNVKKFTQPYGDDEYDDYDEDEEIADDYEEPAERERPARRSMRRTSAPAPADDSGDDDFDAPLMPIASSTAAPAASNDFKGTVLNMSNADSNRQAVVLFHPSSYADSSKAAEDLRNRKAVIVNLENVDKAMARRVVDFLSGCVFALDGEVQKIAQSAYLFCPHNMNIVGNLETLQAEVESYI